MRIRAVDGGFAVALVFGVVPGEQEADWPVLVDLAARVQGHVALVDGLTLLSLELVRLPRETAARTHFDGIPSCLHAVHLEVGYPGPLTAAVSAAGDLAQLWRESRASDVEEWKTRLRERYRPGMLGPPGMR